MCRFKLSQRNIINRIVTLHKTLHRVISTPTDREAVNHLIHVCSNIAMAFLRIQLQRGSLDDYRFGIATEDLAIDCIADTFQRDDNGQFTTLVTYFNSFDWEDAPEEDLNIALRRLIFSKVNEGLFRSYRAEDPNLAKIIRNIKEAIKRNAAFSLQREREIQWIVVGNDQTPAHHLPLAPQAVLEAYITSVLCNTSNTYTAVYAFQDFLKLHPYYRNAYPMSEYARVLRSCFQNREVPHANTQEINLSLIDLENALKKTITYVRSKLHDTYVQKGKISLSMFETYIKALNKILASHFGAPWESVSSQYDALATLIPGLSKDSFQNEHRNIMQYLFKISRTKMIGYLQDAV